MLALVLRPLLTLCWLKQLQQLVRVMLLGGSSPRDFGSRAYALRAGVHCIRFRCLCAFWGQHCR